VVPAKDEVANIPILVAEIRAVMAPTRHDWELLLIDDGSTDGTLDAMRREAGEDPRVRVFRHRKNAGQSAALATGFRAAHGRVVITLDADLQNDPADIPRFLAELDRGFDVVSGVRTNRRDSFTRRVSSKIANAVRNWATDERITDVGCSLKAYRAEFLRDLPLFTGMHRFLPTLVRWNGARVSEIAVRHRPRLHGVAKYGIGNRLFRALADLFAVRWMRKRWLPPGNVEELPK
jgi:glycosyltransferase involved in cell wall biosynthesis